MVELGPRRIPYTVNRGSGYSNPDYRWRWTCPVCSFSVEDRDKELCQQLADAHNCGGGWCALNVPLLCALARVSHGERMYVSTQTRPGGWLPSDEDRRRWR